MKGIVAKSGIVNEESKTSATSSPVRLAELAHQTLFQTEFVILQSVSLDSGQALLLDDISPLLLTVTFGRVLLRGTNKLVTLASADQRWLERCDRWEALALSPSGLRLLIPVLQTHC